MKHHRDFRSLDDTTQAELRRLAFTRIDEGHSRKNVAAIVQVNPQTVGDWCRKRKELEARDCYGERRGRVPGEQQVLGVRAQERLLRTIKEKTPDKAKLPYALWTREAIKALIAKETKVPLRMETVSKYTKRWGLTPQRPAKYAAEQNPEAVRKWVEQTYPAIVKRARNEGAEIHWEDETGVSLATFYAKSYAPKGKTPALRLPAKRSSTSMISSVTNRGDLRFMLYQGALNTNLFLIFLKRLVNDANRKIFLIVDNLKVHHAKRVTEWARLHADAIELFSPPAVRAATEPR
jgi:transposase